MDRKRIIGHSAVIDRLEAVASAKTIPQTLLFSGISGIGKKLVAKRFLSSLLCMEKNSPCAACPSCMQIEHGTHPDFIELEPNETGKIPIGNQDKKETGSVRWLIDRLSRKPIGKGYAVIIDSIEKINREGQNALLKTIEEPPAGSHIILVSSNKSMLLQTILSRSTEIPFGSLSAAEISDILINSGVEKSVSLTASKYSGGSAETAIILSDPEKFAAVTDLAMRISDYLNNERIFDAELESLKKKIPFESVLEILINIFRVKLVNSIKGTDSSEPDGIRVTDPEKLRKTIKIILALKKGFANNLNFKAAFKGMVYSISNMRDTGPVRF